MKKKIFVIIMVLTLASAFGFAMSTPVSATTTSDGFVYSVNPDGNTITITGYVGDNTQIIIPSEIDGKTVTDIGSYAFSKGEVYDETTTKITIPNTVKTVGEYAFYNLRAITEIVIPDSVTHIYEGAFHKCINVTKLTIGKNLTYIGKNGVSRLHALNEINIASGNTAFKVESGCLIDVSCKTVISSLDISNIKIPAGIQQIGDCAFYERTKLTSIVIPDGVVYIGQNAFDGAPLAKVVLPRSVQTIGFAAFANGGNALRSGHVYYEGVNFSEVDGT